MPIVRTMNVRSQNDVPMQVDNLEAHKWQANTLSISAQQEDFLTFIQIYSRIIGQAIWRVCGEKYPALQADIEQEVYVVLWERWNDARSIDYPISYLYKVALRTALVVLRSAMAAVSGDEVESWSMTRQAMSEDTTLTTEHALMLTACLAQLPEEQGRAVRAYLAGFTQREIAHLYGWSGAVTRHRIYRGLQALKSFALQEV